MNLWRLAGGSVMLACLVWAGLLLPVHAQGTDKLDKWEFKAFSGEKPFYQKLVTTTKQEMQVEKQGQPGMTQLQKQTFIIEWKPKGTKGSEYVVEQKIVYAQMSITIGTTNITYDSAAKEQPKNPMTEFFDSLMKVTLTVYVNKDTLEVTKVEGGKEFVDKLGDSHPQMKNLLKSILSDEAIKKMSQQTWAAIKEPATKGVKKDQTWPGESELNLGAIGTYKNKYTYKYEGDDKEGKAKITVQPKMEYSAPKTVVAAEKLPFDIKDTSRLTTDEKESKGEIIFDKKHGRIESSTMKMVISGNVDIDIGGMLTSVGLKQTQDSTLTTNDDKDKLMPPPAK